MLKIKESERERYYLWEAICLFLSMIIFILFAKQKIVWFCDEMYSYTIASKGTFGISIAEQSWCSGNDIANTFFVANDGLHFDRVVSATAGDNHPPIYYLCFHVLAAMIGRYTKWTGLLLNLPFFLGSIAILYSLLYKYCKSTFVAFAGSISVVCNGGILSMALLIRMYMMMTFFLLLFLHLLIKIMEGEERLRFYIGLAGCFIIGFLTNYMFVIYAFFASLAYLFLVFFEKNSMRKIIKYIITMVIGLCVSVLLFPASIRHIFLERKGTDALHQVREIGAIGKSFIDAVEIQNRLLFSKFWWIFVIFFAVIFIFFYVYKKENQDEPRKEVFLVTFTIVMSMTMAKWIFLAENRYLYPTMLLQYFLMIFLVVVCSMKIRNGKKAAAAVYFIFFFLNLFINIPLPHIEYYGVDGMKTQWESLEERRKTPWIYYGEFDWVSMYCALDFTIPEKIYCIESDSSPRYDEILNNERSFIVYINESLANIDDLMVYLESSVGQEFSYRKMMDRLHLVVYEVEKR